MGVMKRNTSVIWTRLFTASIVAACGVLILAAIHIWGKNEPGETNGPMHWALFVILLIAWLLGFSFHLAGAL